MTKLRLFLIPLLLSLAACAGQNRFVLLEEEDGSTGAITVENEGGARTVTQAGTMTQVGSARAAPSEPEAISPEEVEQTWGATLQASPLEPRRFLLYFVFDSDELTAESSEQLPDILDSITGYPAPEIGVVGHTDRVGPAEVNARLALERAEAIRKELLGVGLPAELIEVTSHGEANPLVPTADEVPEPRNRRVEVMVR